MVAYISANGLDELPEEASMADKLDLRDLMGIIFFFVTILSVVIEAEFDMLSPRLLDGAALSSDHLDNGGSSGLGIGLGISEDEPTGRSTR
jgi:hypothetical protein